MKKMLLFCGMMLGLATIHAQSTVLSATAGLESSPTPSSRGIIRERGIAYYEFNGNGCFVHLPTLMGTNNQVETPTKWYIRDFHVVDGIAYFCGIDSNDFSALLGHFHIANLINGMGSIVFHRDYGIASKLSVLNRIAVCHYKDSVGVLAIGRESRGFNPEMDGADRVVYLSDYSSMTGCIFTPSNDYDRPLFAETVILGSIPIQSCYQTQTTPLSMNPTEKE